MTSRRRLPDSGGNQPLSPRRQQILGFIRESTERRGCPPSLKEIADAVGLRSVSAVSYQLEILAKAGYLDRDPRLPRTVVMRPSRLQVRHAESDEITGARAGAGAQNMVSVPLFERIAAGPGTIADPGSYLRHGFQYSEDTMQLPRVMVGSGVLFAVRVAGDSMVNANIFDGDLVVVRQQNSADDGDIVAALIDEEDEEAGATVKTLQHVNGHVWLMPQNAAYKPIPGDHCRLMGKVVATVHGV
jgi:repressor LexA